VRVPRLERVVDAGGGSAMLVMDLVDGSSIDNVAPEDLSDGFLRRLWTEVGRLHGAGIAHRSLRSANVMVDGDGEAWIVDFSFSELAATPRQVSLGPAELLASVAVQSAPSGRSPPPWRWSVPAGSGPWSPFCKPWPCPPAPVEPPGPRTGCWNGRGRRRPPAGWSRPNWPVSGGCAFARCCKS